MADKVLLIDDDIDTLKLVGLMLQHQGYQISAAASGEQGLEKAQIERPDVILLDIMMPDMDGYEVVRRLRQTPETTSTPILMFTAKSQLEDKVAGFEVGVDDYLSKPTTPAELQSHVRQLLEHKREKEIAAARAARRGHVVAVIAARNGLGVTTLAANLAAALRERSKQDVILAELTPGQGSLGVDLGTPHAKALSDLLQSPASQITPERVKSSLIEHPCGIKLLPASDDLRHVPLLGQSEQFEALFECLASLAPYVVLDMGSALAPWAEKILPLCREVMLLAEPTHNIISGTRHVIDELTDLGIDPAVITVILNPREQNRTQLPWAMAQQQLGHPITEDLRPAPELMAIALHRRLPAVIAAPEDVTSQQIFKLADRIAAPAAGA